VRIHLVAHVVWIVVEKDAAEAPTKHSVARWVTLDVFHRCLESHDELIRGSTPTAQRTSQTPPRFPRALACGRGGPALTARAAEVPP
jgi:hypothetical protein